MSDRRFLNNGEHGISLVEVLAMLVVLAVIVATALPGLGEARRAAAVGGASRKLKGLLFRCRAVYQCPRVHSAHAATSDR